MFNRPPFAPRIYWSPADGGAPPTGDQAPAGGVDWWKSDKLSSDQQETLTTLGLTVEDPVDAIGKLADMERTAKMRLGAAPEDLLTKPKPGDDVAEWLRNNGETFGIPDAPDKYEVAKPENWPEDATWNETLEGEARKIAHEEGITQKGLQRMTDLFAGEVSALDRAAGDGLSAATDAMRGALQKDWGDQFDAKITLARQAASAIAEQSGLDADGIQNVSGLLATKTGDPETIRMFAAIGEMMGTDVAIGLGKGASNLGTTPAEARADLAKLRAPGGEYYQAVATGNRAAMTRLKPRIEQLTKLAAQS